MAKVVREERLALVIVLTRESGVGPVEVSCRADYEVASDDLTVTRSMEIPLTSARKTSLRTFGAFVLAEVRQAENG